MARRRPSAGLVKVHRTYTIAEVAALFGVHRNTVRRWIREGLPVLNERKPYLILGRYLAAFLVSRKMSQVKLKPGEFFCVSCRAARRPALAMADYVPITGSSGNLRGLCPICETLMHRRTALCNIATSARDLDVTIVEALPRLSDRQPASVNCHLEQERQTNGIALPAE